MAPSPRVFGHKKHQEGTDRFMMCAFCAFLWLSMTNLDNWRPPDHWTKITTIDLHTGGEPLRVVVAGLPVLEGQTVLEKRGYFSERYDHIRTGLMREPRGHADMYGAVVTPSLDADFDVFFLHNEGYSTMCGHAIIALTKLVIEAGLIDKESITFNVPAGKIHARATVKDSKVVESSFRNVPSFLYLSDGKVNAPTLGQVTFDIAYGGAFYAIVEAQQLGLSLLPEHHDQLIDYGRRIKQAVANEFEIRHPFEDELSFLYGTIFTSAAIDRSHHSRNVCIFADGQLDRSPTGSGLSARAALHHAKGELKLNEKITVESILGSTMSVELVAVTSFGPYNAVVPEVSGSASFTGRHEFYFDPDDLFQKGLILPCRSD